MNSVLDTNPYLAVRQAFDAPWDGPKGPKVILNNSQISLAVYPEDGCRMTSLNAFGYELLRQWNPARRAFQYGCFPMIPWVGRMGNAVLNYASKAYSLPMNKPPHALHGMACFGPWQTISVTPEVAEFSVELEQPWPWKGQVVQRFELDSTGLTITLTVKTAGEAFPAAAGWHPWFAKWTGDTDYVAVAPIGEATDKLKVSFDADWQEEPGDNELPTGKRIAPRPGPWDDCFGFNQGMSASLVWPGKVRLSMSSETSSMVVFDKQPDAACIEPLSGPPNCVNTAPIIVMVDKPLVISTRWELNTEK
ncbi:aldose 1-epimerase [Budvicia diplopodorum]|uniref:aldose epimerase family protein n=1 Tax=Budvicia diplopodorum TaxID=1119056 RepID=UPI00135C63A2|nr:aldose 1-epimerase [Budvicia diplopodorum]